VLLAVARLVLQGRAAVGDQGVHARPGLRPAFDESLKDHPLADTVRFQLISFQAQLLWLVELVLVQLVVGLEVVEALAGVDEGAESQVEVAHGCSFQGGACDTEARSERVRCGACNEYGLSVENLAPAGRRARPSARVRRSRRPGSTSRSRRS